MDRERGRGGFMWCVCEKAKEVEGLFS